MYWLIFLLMIPAIVWAPVAVGGQNLTGSLLPLLATAPLPAAVGSHAGAVKILWKRTEETPHRQPRKPPDLTWIRFLITQTTDAPVMTTDQDRRPTTRPVEAMRHLPQTRERTDRERNENIVLVRDEPKILSARDKTLACLLRNADIGPLVYHLLREEAQKRGEEVTRILQRLGVSTDELRHVWNQANNTKA